MLIIHASLAAIAVVALALRPRSWQSAAIVAAIALLELALGAPVDGTVAVIAPLAAFLTAALTLAAIMSETGLIEAVAERLARYGGGRNIVLYLLVCALCALLTAVISLDGAIVLVVPLVLALHRRHRAPLAPSLLGVIAVANAASIAVPQGNPTNLVVISRLQISALVFSTRMLLPALLGTGLCVASLAFWYRHELRGRYEHRRGAVVAPLSGEQRRAAGLVVVAALLAWGAPLAGIEPWWPFIAVVAVAVVVRRRVRAIAVPWRITVQIAGLAIVIGSLGIAPPALNAVSIPVLLAVALGSGVVAATINNLPASVWAASLLSAGPVAYGATIGLATGALAAPHGSVATLLATDLAGDEAAVVSARRLAPLALGATMVATLVLGLGL